MPIADLPFQERVVCSITAAVKYEVPANIVLAVAEKEAGKPGQWVRNSSNGTHDVGPMQFNTAYLRDLAGYGITANDVAAAGCYPFDLAAWRLRGHIKNDKGDIWTRAANYHSRTPQYNSAYRADLIAKADRWADWLDALFSMDAAKSSMTVPTSTMQLATMTVSALEKPTTKVLWKAVGAGYVPRKLLKRVDETLGKMNNFVPLQNSDTETPKVLHK